MDKTNFSVYRTSGDSVAPPLEAAYDAFHRSLVKLLRSMSFSLYGNQIEQCSGSVTANSNNLQTHTFRINRLSWPFDQLLGSARCECS